MTELSAVEVAEKKTEEQRDLALRQDLSKVINMHNRENGSDTPDFILAAHLSDCLEVFDKTVGRRKAWYSSGSVEGIPASEVLYLFVAWLTTKEEVLTIGASENCGVWADRVKQFCEHNNLAPVRDNKNVYKGLSHPD